MKGVNYFIIFLAIIFQNCTEQTSPKKEIHNNDFNWTITIPENFESVSAEQWTKMQNKGREAIEKTYDAKVDNQAKTIFVFKNDQLNYFESNYQPFDSTTDGNYLESWKSVNEILYQTFISQMQGTKIDTTTSTEKIDNLEFQTLKMIVTYPNNRVLNILMFSRLFDKKEFTVNIMYVDNKKGELMLDSWKKSTFGKK
jgi:hypothetical protein